MQRIYVASPYAGDIKKKIEFAKNACRFVMEQGHAFFCPHLLYPNVLTENNPEERQLALDMGIARLQSCDEMWCFGDHISHGMMNEIEEAQRLSIPIRRVMKQEQGFHVGEIRNHAPRMEMGTIR